MSTALLSTCNIYIYILSLTTRVESYEFTMGNNPHRARNPPARGLAKGMSAVSKDDMEGVAMIKVNSFFSNRILER